MTDGECFYTGQPRTERWSNTDGYHALFYVDEHNCVRMTTTLLAQFMTEMGWTLIETKEIPNG